MQEWPAGSLMNTNIVNICVLNKGQLRESDNNIISISLSEVIFWIVHIVHNVLHAHFFFFKHNWNLGLFRKYLSNQLQHNVLLTLMLPVEGVFYYHEGSKKSKEEAVQESRVFKKLLNDIVLGQMTFPLLEHW